MQCGCAAALKGMAAKGRQHLLVKSGGLQTCHMEELKTLDKFYGQKKRNYRTDDVFVELGNVPKWRSVAVVRSPSLWERWKCRACAQG